MENQLNRVKITAAQVLKKLGVSADFLTVTGMLLAGVAGFLIFNGQFFLGGVTLLLSGILDLLDGAVARLTAKPHYFGGILDSTLDRYGDAFALGGALFYCASSGYYLYAFLAFLAIIGSFAVSYVRARAECQISGCRVGFWERGERIVFLALALLCDNLPAGLVILAIGTQMTAFFRLFYSNKPDVSMYKRTPFLEFLFHTAGRQHPYYYVKIGLLLAVLFLVKIPF